MTAFEPPSKWHRDTNRRGGHPCAVDVVQHDGVGHEDETTLGPALPKPDAELRVVAGIADAKAADLSDGVDAKRHVPAPEVPYVLPHDWHTAVRASDDPLELLRKPVRTAAVPDRLRQSADAGDVRILVRLSEDREPALVGLGVVVHEGDAGGRRCLHARVTSARSPGRPRWARRRPVQLASSADEQ